MKGLDSFINDQLSQWPMACENFRALRSVHTRRMTVGGLEVTAQSNPARIGSSAAKTDSASLKERACFLCPENRYPEQIFLRFDGRKGRKYDVLVNPFPVFPDHLVIASATHSEQSIWKRFTDMLDLCHTWPDFIFFYNGPKCGASAPDHHHFQATGRGNMPLENDVDRLLDAIPPKNDTGNDSRTEGHRQITETSALQYLTSISDADLYHYNKFTCGIYVLRGRTVKSTARLFYRLLDCAPLIQGDREPRFNLFTYYKSGEYRCIVVFRTQHRSHHYFSTGPDHLTMSPGCVDMAGLFIVPVREDYEKLSPELLTDMLSEVSISPETDRMICTRLTRGQRLLSVGIMSAPEIVFEIRSDGAGKRKAILRGGRIEYDGALYDELYFEARPLTTMFAEPTFVLHGVTIGKGFHWQRTENQRFAGALKIIVEGDQLTAVNVIGVEDYLLSVISSEMNAAASLEFLKAHAVISRSWVMARLEHSDTGEDVSRKVETVPLTDGLSGVADGSRNSSGASETRITCWYGSSQHRNYDVCADDHCQRYQGVSRAVGRNVRDAIDATWGEVLTYDGRICDARFSKCCGGMTELFSTCWDDRDMPYLQALADTQDHVPYESDDDASSDLPQRGNGLMSYAESRDRLLDEFVESLPEDDTGDVLEPRTADLSAAKPFCDTADPAILSQVLNDYDRETTDFYRWSVVYGRDEISSLISQKTGVDIGTLAALEPLETGPSGRIKLLRIVGDKAVVTVGKELEIRKVLSTSHLKSSAFVPVYLDSDGNPVAMLKSNSEFAGTENDAAGTDSKPAGTDAKPARTDAKPAGTDAKLASTNGRPAGNWTQLLLRGKGWGHGVGLCQIGAAVMASQGYDYRAILAHYYPGTTLDR